VALPQVVGRLGHYGLGLASLFAALPLACGQGLVGGSRHVEQHLAQVRAAFGTPHILVDDFAPARAHGLADQFVHAVGSACTFGVRDVVHRRRNGLDRHFVVQRDANFEGVDGFLRWEGPLVGHLKAVGFHVGQSRFDVPQAVFAVKTLVHDGSRM